MTKVKAREFFIGTMQIDLRAELGTIRKNALARRSKKDLLWWKLCGVVATSGSAVHAKEFMALYNQRLAFRMLSRDELTRREEITTALVDAKVPRMREKKVEWLSANYDLVEKIGGAEKATREMLSLNGKEQKMKWIRQFHGVGAKYSRDIWMDIYDPDFHDSVALDARVMSFAERLGFDKKAGNLEEQLLKFAQSCNLTGWEFDRLIFNFGGLIIQML